MTKELIINQQHWATYEIHQHYAGGHHLFLNVNKKRFKKIDSDLENLITAIIGELEYANIKALSYLNI